MKNLLKRELLNEVITGLLVAASFAAIMPANAWADLTSATANAGTGVLDPIIRNVTYISYGLGTVMVVAGISDVKKHTENPGSNPLGKGLGKLGAGAAFLAAPFMANMLQSTSNTVTGGGNTTFTAIGGV